MTLKEIIMTGFTTQVLTQQIDIDMKAAQVYIDSDNLTDTM